MGVIQPAAPSATPAIILPKTPVNAKQKSTIAPIPAKKIQRLNGAKFVMTNNCEKVDVTVLSFEFRFLVHTQNPTLYIPD